MVHISGSIVIDRPVEEVFDVVLDSRHEPAYNPAMRECRLLTGEPVGVGSRFASTMSNRGRPVQMVTEVTQVVRPRYLGSRTEGAGTVVTGGLTLTPEGERATRLGWDWQLQPTGPTRLLTPVIALMGGRMERGIWGGLKRWLEARPPSG
jgi:uncharacterized protein YndB with AHSA1/START domain